MASTSSSCIAHTPLVELEGETARASILNYNLPTSTTFRVKNYITINIPDDYWNEEAMREAVDNPHKVFDLPAQTQAEPVTTAPITIGSILTGIIEKPFENKRPIKPDPIDDPVRQYSNDPFDGRLNPVLIEMAATLPALKPLLVLNKPEQYFNEIESYNTHGLVVGSNKAIAATRPIVTKSAGAYLRQAEALFGTSISSINLHAAYRELPAFRRALYGNYRTDFVKNPSGARPSLVLIEEYEVASFLGDYGAGRTIKTFSLLPGEKTTISIKTFRTTTENKSKTENILDSFSQQSADTLETMFNEEHADSGTVTSASSTGFSSTENWQESGSISVSAGLDLKIFSAKSTISGTMSHSDQDINTSSSNATRSDTTGNLRKSIDRHVAQSEAARKIDVNTETQQSVSTTSGEETTIVREIQNINHSRELNFVFRQLCQEYVTVTYLNDVSFGFTKGYIGDGRSEKLHGLDKLLRSVLKEKFVPEVKATLIDELANVYDYKGTRFSFVERVEEEVHSLVNADQPVRKRVYFRKNTKPELMQSWGTGPSKTVNGIILDVSRRILTTDAVIVEALLGQGEALDCYNQRLQDAAANRADAENKAKLQAIDIINGIDGANDKANLYKKVFGTDPQTIVKSIGDE